MSSEIRAVVYTRVSTEEQAMNNTSLEDQRDRGLRACELRGALPVKVCEDAGISGARYTTRPGLMEALRLIESGAANLLLVSKIDRIGRMARIILEVAERVDRAGGQIVTCDGMEVGKTATGRMLLTMLAAFAEFERDSIRDRCTSGKVRKALDGVQTCRAFSPFGYRITTKSDTEKGINSGDTPGTYVVIEDQARWVRQIYAWFAEGMSLRGIAAALDERAVPTARGAAGWRATTVRQILMNSVYRGVATFGRVEVTSGENLTLLSDSSRLSKCGKQIRTREKPIAEIRVPAIVDEALWYRCNEIAKSNADEKKAQHGGNPGKRYLLTSMTRCPVCGNYMKGQGKKRQSGNIVQYYACWGIPTCPNVHHAYRADKMHDAALRAVLHVAEHPSATAEALRAYEDHKREQLAASDTVQERERVTSDLARVNADIDVTRRAMVQAMKAGLREDDFTADLERLACDRQKAEARLQALSLVTTPDKPTEDPVTTAGKLAKVAGSIAKVFEAAEEDYTTAEKQALLYRVIESVTPAEEGAVVKFKALTVHGVLILCTVRHGKATLLVVGPEETRAAA